MRIRKSREKDILMTGAELGEEISLSLLMPHVPITAAFSVCLITEHTNLRRAQYLLNQQWIITCGTTSHTACMWA